MPITEIFILQLIALTKISDSLASSRDLSLHMQKI